MSVCISKTIKMTSRLNDQLTEAPSATDAYENSPAPEDIPVDDTPEGMEGAQRPSAVPRRIGFRMSSICWDYEDEDEDRS